MGAQYFLHLLQLAVVVPALVLLVQAGAEDLLVLQPLHQALHLVLEAHPLYFAAAVAAASASDADAGAFAGALQLLATWSWCSLAGPAVLARPVVLLAAEDPPHLPLQAGIVKRGVSLVVPDQAA